MVKRWDCTMGATVYETAAGEFVTYDDYATLEAERDQLRAELERRAMDGWKLVPVEPTEAMKIAGNNAGFWCVDTYRAMLAAAPSAPKAEPVKVQLLEALKRIAATPFNWREKSAITMCDIASAAIAAARQEGGKV